jgi:5-(carboxyamino)imidazole ribonucleotide synthase
MTKIGVIGAGQLGQMLGYAGQSLGLEFVFLDPADKPPAATVGPVLKYAFDSDEGLKKLASETDVITYEFENVPVAALAKLSPDTVVYPPAEALEHAQDRVAEKSLFGSLDIPVAPYRAVDTVDDLRKAADALGLPIVLKTRRLGYDGKGQIIVRDAADIENAVAELGGSALVAEQWVPFDREVSAIGARNVSGDIAVYPLTENEHRNGILSVSRAPAVAGALGETATAYLTRLLNRLDYVGVLALELFVVGDRLLANEFAPRVHNSGHWTIEGAETSQFENHLRAILDMRLGSTAMRGCAGMLNLIGNLPADCDALRSGPWHLHDYGKDPRPGRKLGHATVVTEDPQARDQALRQLANSLNI